MFHLEKCPVNASVKAPKQGARTSILIQDLPYCYLQKQNTTVLVVLMRREASYLVAIYTRARTYFKRKKLNLCRRWGFARLARADALRALDLKLAL